MKLTEVAFGPDISLPRASHGSKRCEQFGPAVPQEPARAGAQATEDYLAERNADPRPYRWRAKGERILARLRRARGAQQSVISTYLGYGTLVGNSDLRMTSNDTRSVDASEPVCKVEPIRS